MSAALFMQGRHLNVMVLIVWHQQGGFRDSLKGAAVLHPAPAEYEQLGLTQHYSVQGMFELARVDHALSGLLSGVLKETREIRCFEEHGPCHFLSFASVL
jgi:hypothetical protein